MKKIIIGVLIGSGIVLACSEKDTDTTDGTHQHHYDTKDIDKTEQYINDLTNGVIADDTLKGSPERVVINTIGKLDVHISYHSPGVKNRVIWGGLVPYKTVWVTGAHTATSICFTEPVRMDGKRIEKGTYAIFTIPEEEYWTVILNRNYEQHLTDNYKETEDIVRLKVKPLLTEEAIPRLTFSIESDGANSGRVVFGWEKLMWEVPFQIEETRN